MKKRDVLLIIAVAAVAGALLLGSMILSSGKTASGMLNVYVDGAFYTSSAIEDGKTLVIEQEDGSKNVIRMTENGFYMEFSTCHNQLCIDQGTVDGNNWHLRSLGTHVICLPNRVDVELVLSEGETNAAELDAPDI